jgi:hypothetical protein
MRNYRNKIETAITRQQISHRGGGIEIDLAKFGFKHGSRMSAYQNYLGGGLLGRIETNHNIFRTSFTTTEAKKLEALALQLAKYFHELTNHDEDEWESATFEQNQNRPISAY